ncbi:MAG: RluA family pseudouridine synthase [Planctomycetota bacterium]|nr:RluA family pseudouridine synthase [Planctomycetota bacterium]
MPKNNLPEGSLSPEALPERELETLDIVLAHEPADPRLDRFLAARWPSHSRTTYQKLIRGGRALVNDEPVTKPSAEVHKGDHVLVTLYKRLPLGIIPEPIPIEVLYEDEDMLVVNKAPGIIVHPARGNPHGTLVNAVAHHAERLSKVGGPWRPGVVHRLDRDTSGIIIFAKNDTAHTRLARQWEDRTVEKEYVTIVEGVPQLDADVISAPLGKDRRVRDRYAVRGDRHGREAHSRYEVAEAFDGFALLHVWPRTGRTHQIRVHLAHIGHRVAADRQYGSRDKVTLQEIARGRADHDEVLMARQALHAAGLTLQHPRTRLAVSGSRAVGSLAHRAAGHGRSAAGKTARRAGRGAGLHPIVNCCSALSSVS